MKKTGKIIALLMAVMMLVSLCACAPSPYEQIAGTWRCELDVTDAMNTELASALDVDEIDSDVSLIFPIEITLREDQTCYFAYDKDAITDSFDSYIDWMGDWLVDYMMDSLVEETGLDEATLNAFFESEYGTSIAGYTDELLTSSIDVEDLLENAVTEFNAFYVLSDGKMFVGNHLDEISTEGDDYMTYTFEDDILTLVDTVGELNVFWDDIGEFAEFPLEFTRK